MPQTGMLDRRTGKAPSKAEITRRKREGKACRTSFDIFQRNTLGEEEWREWKRRVREDTAAEKSGEMSRRKVGVVGDGKKSVAVAGNGKQWDEDPETDGHGNGSGR